MFSIGAPRIKKESLVVYCTMEALKRKAEKRKEAAAGKTAARLRPVPLKSFLFTFTPLSALNIKMTTRTIDDMRAVPRRLFEDGHTLYRYFHELSTDLHPAEVFGGARARGCAEST